MHLCPLPPLALTVLHSFHSCPHPTLPPSGLPQPLISVGHSAGSRGGARLDSGGAVTTTVEERHAHMGAEDWAGIAGGMQVGWGPQWPVGRGFPWPMGVGQQWAVGSGLPWPMGGGFLWPVKKGSPVKVRGRASEEEVMARLKGTVNSLLLHIHPEEQDSFLEAISTLVLTDVSQQPDMVKPVVAAQLLCLPSLTALHFYAASIASDALPLFQSAAQLHRLVIACYKPFALLSNRPANRQANLPPPSDPSASEFQPFQPFAGLKELHVSCVTDSMLQQVGVLTSLEQAYAKVPRTRIDGSMWEVVAALPGLQHLELHSPEPSTAAVRSLSSITHLTPLCITSTPLDDSDLLGLRSLSLLTKHSLAACAFEADQAVRSVIQGMTQL
ncbi:unnamed protein product [Closterium sp. Naga37s-1]|nr:unnamed protein product [Closterium sp. Naga37s-1]